MAHLRSTYGKAEGITDHQGSNAARKLVASTVPLRDRWADQLASAFGSADETLTSFGYLSTSLDPSSSSFSMSSQDIMNAFESAEEAAAFQLYSLKQPQQEQEQVDSSNSVSSSSEARRETSSNVSNDTSPKKQCSKNVVAEKEFQVLIS